MRNVTSKVLMVAIAGVVVLTVMDPASAARGKRAPSAETGPLIMSASFGAMASYRRPRSAEICRPVTIRVR
jgi:hypothetical protein